MLPALLITLREGVEAALVVGIVLVYLSRTGRAALARFVWSGVAAAIAASVVGALALERWKLNQEGIEGVLLLAAAVFVVTMIVWMNRAARHLKRQIEQRVERLAGRAALAAGLGVAAFVFLMVVREGMELVLILRAVGVTTEGLGVWLGAGTGLALAVLLGVFIFQGTVKISLPKFFSATSVILTVVAAQLAITGLHELSESLWIPSSREEMAVIGPIVRNDVFFFLVILCVAAWLLLREWIALRPAMVRALQTQDPKSPVAMAAGRGQRHWMFAGAMACLAVVIALGTDFVLARVSAAPAEAVPVVARNGEIRIPVAAVLAHKISYFSLEDAGQTIRFLVIRRPSGSLHVALDACRICGPASNRPEGDALVCLNCNAEIPLSALDVPGGCNPVPVGSRTENGNLVISVAALTGAVPPTPES